jgi:hypothetical protein
MALEIDLLVIIALPSAADTSEVSTLERTPGQCKQKLTNFPERAIGHKGAA